MWKNAGYEAVGDTLRTLEPSICSPYQQYATFDSYDMTASDRSLGVLKLFTLERPVWTADEMAAELGVSSATIYRFIRALEEVGLIAGARAAKFTLGPAIIQLDRQIQLSDPMLRAAEPVMSELRQYAPEGAVVLLCRSYGDSVLCMRQVVSPGPQALVSYERGRPMPLFAGATSKVILAHQPRRMLKALYAKHGEAIAAAGLGSTWGELLLALTEIRKVGYAITVAEIDRGRIGIAAPILDDERQAIGSLSFVVNDATEMRQCHRLASLAVSGAREIEAAMSEAGSASQPNIDRLVG
jgi:DNA-binding IclR family transcriptional regulator